MIAIYTRQSLDKKDSLSIETQVEKCIALCNYNNWEYEIFKDVGFSGKNLDRPAFKMLMAGIREGIFDKILCYRLDRISRSIADFSNLIIELEKYNAEFISATENFDTCTPIGRAMVNIIMTFAQLERETLATRITDNYYFRANQGYWGGGPAPYGYKLRKIKANDGKNHSILIIDEKEADVVKQIYNMYLEDGGSVRKIITKLNQELLIRTRNGSLWTSRVVSDLLWKPLYTCNDINIYNYFKNINANILNNIEDFDGTKAVNLYGKVNKQASKHKRCRDIKDLYFIVSAHKPIIDSDTWIKVQNKKGIVNGTPPRTGTSVFSPFTGLMKCNECKRSVSILKSKGSKYYVCSSRKNLGKNACSLPLINQKIDNNIINSVKIHFKQKETLENLEKAIIKAKNTNYDKEKNNLLAEEIKINKEIENLLNSIANGNDIVNKYLNNRISMLDTRKLEINHELNKIEIAKNSINPELDRLLNIKKIISDIDNEFSKDIEHQKAISKLLLNSITFDKDKEFHINFFI